PDPDESNSGDMEVDGAVQKGPNDISEYQLDTYDDEEGGVGTREPFHPQPIKGPFSNMKWLLSHDGTTHIEIYPTDNLIVVAKVEADVAQMEVFVYDESKDNLYAITISCSPLSHYTGNFIAVGTFEPEIEIWSLDTMDAVYPMPLSSAVQWRQSPTSAKKQGNQTTTVKLWDLSGGSGSSAIRSYNIHQDKVQTVHWCPNESTVLLTGGLDHTLRMFDTRAPTSVVGVKLNEEIEVLRWDPWDPSGFYVALKDGSVRNFDARTLSGKMDSAPRFNIAAHHGSALGLDVNPHLRGCIATGGHDEIVKVWDVKTNATTQELDVSMVASKELGVGKAFSVTWSPDDPLTLAAGVWDVSTSKDAFRTFKSKLYEAGKEIELRIGKSEVIGVDDDDDDDENDDDADPTSAFGM
ncbi:WD40-repeat-containing domain protein, partial [Cantharellus anzutake]|uniref:WD40-repeat-containing domain protein n=1 Tax=Cantharellus anzutake TaxID=1750568 RepID=UPI001906C305